MCLNKVPVFDKEKNTIHYYSCGHCVQCLNNKARRYKSMCLSQFDISNYCLFVTLTYAPEYLPTVKVFSYDSQDYNGVLCKCVTHYALDDRVIKYYGSEILEETFVYDDNEFNHLLKPFQYRKFNLKPNEYGFLFRHDVQLFMKRLRERLCNHLASVIYNNNYKKLLPYEKKNIIHKVSQLKSFICGEYGPKTFRPHFHLLLYFQSSELYDFIFNNVGKIWKFGRVDVQCAGKDANGYVSGYVNSYASTPTLLRTSFARPFSQHSLFFGVNVDEEYNKKISENGYSQIRERLSTVNGRFENFSYPRSLENLLYPKIYRFTCSTDYQLIRRYTSYATLSRYFGETNIKKIVKLYLSEQYAWVWDKHDFLHNTLDIGLLCPYSENEESTLTTILYTSKKFLLNCKHFCLHPNDYLKLIINYYNEKDSFALRDFYIQMSHDSNLLDDKKYLSYFYDNIVPDYDYYHDSAYISHDEYRKLHYHIVKNFASTLNISVTELFDSVKNATDSTFIYDKVYMQEKIAKDNIKHKLQNDLNNIFL